MRVNNLPKPASVLWLLAAMLIAAPAHAQGTQPKVTRLELRVEPESRRIRPFENAVIQVKVYGEIDDSKGKRQGRLKQAGWTLSLTPAGGEGGWVSKPFKFQGTDDETFIEAASSAFESIFRNIAGQFTIKDSVVYHAPEKPGKYRVQATLGSVKAEVEIEVDDKAPTLRKMEKYTFGPEAPVADPYRKLAERWAPYVAQETWFDWKADALCRTDFDNDWDTGNNWDNLYEGSSQAYVYYAAVETKTHWFLIYNFFHARDYSDNCLAGSCHENDNEGVILTVRKDGTESGKLEVMETLAHNNVYSYTSDPSIGKNAHNVEGPIALDASQRPIVFLEAGGHGALGGGDKKATFDASGNQWRTNTGITYVFKGVAERPRHGVDKEVGYELLPIYHHWWAKARRGSSIGGASPGSSTVNTFSAFFRYAPSGGRPGMRYPSVGGSFWGVKHGRDKAKPFWGWHDMATQRRKILATGQWGADPAYGVSRNLRFPADKPVSLDYVFNPYLDSGGDEPQAAEVVRNVTVHEPAAQSAAVDPSPAVAPSPAPAASTSGIVETSSSSGSFLPSVALSADNGSCSLSVRVDGVLEIRLELDHAQYRVLEGAPQEQQSFVCTAAVPQTDSLEFRIEQSSGRGTIKLLDASTGLVEIRDPDAGGGDYRLKIAWTKR